MTDMASMVRISATLENLLDFDMDIKDRKCRDKEEQGKVGSTDMLGGVLVVVVCTLDKLEEVFWGISGMSGEALEGMSEYHLHLHHYYS
jgi:hypothetical protein